MASTKKVRTRIKSTSKIVKKNIGTGKASVSKTRSIVKRTATKPLASKAQSKTVKKAGNVDKKTKSPQQAIPPAKVKETINKTVRDKRTKREISGAEYDAFVNKAAKKAKVLPEELVTVDRRTAKPKIAEPPTAEPSALKIEENKEPRRKVQRRRQIDPTTCERDYSQEEIEFMNALDEYKRNSGRMFPTCSEILEVFRSLGYMKQSHEATIEFSEFPESDSTLIDTNETDAMGRNDEYLYEDNAIGESMVTFF